MINEHFLKSKYTHIHINYIYFGMHHLEKKNIFIYCIM